MPYKGVLTKEALLRALSNVTDKGLMSKQSLLMRLHEGDQLRLPHLEGPMKNALLRRPYQGELNKETRRPY